MGFINMMPEDNEPELRDYIEAVIFFGLIAWALHRWWPV
jgi:hypothetical protein